jgi:hypothetical protein
MESQQQPKYVDTSSPAVTRTLESPPLATLPPAPQSDQQWQRIGTQISVFLGQLPDYVGRFFNEYKQLILSFALLVATMIALRVVLVVVVALKDIPLLAPTFELIGIGYSVWFVNRYLLKTSNRQELSGEVQKLKQQVFGSQQLPKSQN